MRDATHLRYFTRAGLAATVAHAGFEVVDARDVYVNGARAPDALWGGAPPVNESIADDTGVRQFLLVLRPRPDEPG